MSVVSNFITEHIEQMKPDGVKAVLFPVGESCFTLDGDSSVVQSKDHCGNIDEDELREDLSALGLDLEDEETYYYRYDPQGIMGKDSIYLRIRTFNEYRLIIQIELIAHPEKLMREILRDNPNPLTVFEYQEYAY